MLGRLHLFAPVCEGDKGKMSLTDEDKESLARSLGIILLTMLAAIIFAFGYHWSQGNVQTARAIGLSCFPVLVSLWLTRRGQVGWATFLVLVSLLALATYLLFAGDGLRDIAVLLFPVAIIVASLLLSNRAVVMIAGLSILALGFVVYGQLTGRVRTADASASSLVSDLIMAILILVITAVAVRRLADNMRDGLSRAQRNERALEESNRKLQAEIIDRQRADLALQSSEARLRSLLAAMPDLILVIGPHGECLDLFTGNANLLVAPRNEQVGRTINDFLPPAVAGQAQQILERALTTRTVQEYEYQLPTPRGHSWFQARVVAYDDPQGPCILWLTRDVTEHKETQDALAQSEERFRALIEDSSDAIAVLNARFESIYRSPSRSRVLGYEDDEALGPLDTVHPDDLPAATKALESIVREPGATCTMQVRLKHKDGSWRWVEVRGKNLLNNPGVKGIVVNYNDITERKRAEQAYQTLVQHSLQGFAIIQEGRVVFGNSALAVLSGYTLDELYAFSPEQVSGVVHPDDRERVTRNMQDRIFGKPMSPRQEFRLLRKSGEVCWVETLASMIDYCDKPALQIAYLDITERRHAEEELRKLSQAVEQSPASIVITDTAGNIEYVNPKFTRITGYAREEVIGGNPRILKSGETSPEEYKRLWDTISAGGEWRGEFHNKKKNGELYWENASISPITDEAGVITHFLAVKEDITERKRAEEALEQSENRFSRIFNASPIPITLSRFADGVYLDANDSFLRFSGFTREEVIGHTVSELGIYPEPEQRSILMKTLHDRGRLQGYDQPLRTKAGRIMDTSLWVEPISVNHEPLLLVLALDTTERKRAEQQIQRQLQRLNALHTIDTTITSLFNLPLILNLFLEQVTTLLSVDAAAVLLLRKSTQTLDYAAGRGFRTQALQHTHLRLGEGLAGRVALERRVLNVLDLREAKNSFVKSPSMEGERFVVYFGVPLIAKGQVQGVLEVFHRQTLVPDKDWLTFLETLATQTAIAIDNMTLFSDLQQSNAELSLAYDTTLEGWSRALDLRDKETEGHTQRVTEMAVRLCRAMGIGESDLVHVRRGAFLHDIGKMGIPDSILLKPAPLTPLEWETMRQHPVFAHRLLSPIAHLRPALDIPYCHHEKWDGSGYPRGLRGEEIPLVARIFAVVDVWDALRSDRPYRRAWPAETTREYIRSMSGMHFDPAVVDLFLRILANERV